MLKVYPKTRPDPLTYLFNMEILSLSAKEAQNFNDDV